LLGILHAGYLAIDVVTALTAILPLSFIKIPQPERLEQVSSTVWQDFKAGLRYMLGWKGLLIVSLMTVGLNFTIIPAFSLLPLMVKDYFGGGALQLSWVEAAMGIGMFLGGALLSVWGGFPRKILTSMLGLMGMGTGTLVLALAPSSAMFLAVGGGCRRVMTPITMGPFIIQSNVEPGYAGAGILLLSSVGTNHSRLMIAVRF
jgi:DHA3 family macrolide efflux protein-like MFS transporter